MRRGLVRKWRQGISSLCVGQKRLDKVHRHEIRPDASRLCEFSGSCLPSLFLLPGRRLNSDILSECSVPGATVTVAAKALRSKAIFVKWLEHFASSVPNSVIRILLLFYASCARHYIKRFVEKAIETKVILPFLSPHSTHILQPLEVLIFNYSRLACVASWTTPWSMKMCQSWRETGIFNNIKCVEKWCDCHAR